MKIALILKFPDNKPPCICMLFEDKYEAETFNKHAINSYHTSFYNLDFFVDSDDKLSIRFTMDNSDFFKLRYYITKYNQQELKDFLEKVKYQKLFSFCHIAEDKGTQKVVRSCSNSRLWVLKVNKISFDAYALHV